MNELSAENGPAIIPIRFHFYRLKFTPYSSSPETSHSILEKVATFLSQEKVKGNGILIDRHESRGGESARPLFVTQAVKMIREKRMRFSMALLRTGRIPLVKPTDKFLLIPFDKSKGEIAEQTHFFIDYDTSSIVVCVEFNYNGPRASDIEYYFRIVARDKLKIAKATEMELFMDTSIDKTLSELKNVLRLEVKVQPHKLSQLDPLITNDYFTGITKLGQFVNPNYVKLDISFQTTGRQYTSSQINRAGNKMAATILNAFKAKQTNMDAFDNFVVKYEDTDGREEVFNLLKGKKEITVNIAGEITNTRKLYELIESELNEFVNTLR